MDDNQVLLQGLRERNAEAMARAFDLYAPALFRYASHHGSSIIPADHIVGDVFAKLLEQLAVENCPRSNLRSYLFEIAYHLIVDEFRNDRRTVSMEAFEVDFPAAACTDRAAEKQILLETVMCAVRERLSEDQRQVIFLRFLEEFSLKETAQIMGKTVNNIKLLQHRGVAAIRKALDELPVVSQ